MLSHRRAPYLNGRTFQVGDTLTARTFGTPTIDIVAFTPEGHLVTRCRACGQVDTITALGVQYYYFLETHAQDLSEGRP